MTDKNSRPIVLLYPPPSDPTQPYSSLPALTGFLRSHGFKVIQKDLGIEMLNELLTPASLRKARDLAVNRADLTDPESGSEYFKRYYGIIGLSDYIIGHVDEAKCVMRDKTQFSDLKRYQWAANILGMACELVSLPHHPTRLEPYSYETDIELSFKGLFEGTSGRFDNLFFEIFAEKVVPEILKLNPLFVGISTTYHFQIIPAFTLSRLLKQASPELHINIGGAIIQDMEADLLLDPKWFAFADSFVVGEGETSLVRLAENLLAGDNPGHDVKNLISLVNGVPAASGLRWYEDMKSLPCPDYDGLGLDQYLSPEPVLLLSSTRGCYYGKCAFCDVTKNTKAFHRQMDNGQFTDHICEMHRKYGADRFFLCDDAMPPAKMLTLAKLVTEKLPGVTWQAEARFEKVMTPEFLSAVKKGGCRQLSFGFESASQRVLDMMNKNNSAKLDREILDSCAKNGIAVNLQTFIGFPTETREEARETIDFLIENEQKIASIGFGIFSLFKDTPVHKNPEHFCIRDVSISPSLFGGCEYTPLSGMTLEEIEEEHKAALEIISSMYNVRGFYLSKAMGAHSLLQFSYYDYPELYRMWKEMGAPQWEDTVDMGDTVLNRNPSLMYSSSGESAPSGLRVFCSDTGNQFFVSSSEQRLLELCDGSPMGDIASRWADEQTKDFSGRIVFMTRAFASLREFLRKGLVISGSNA
ncbi:MAG: radical SAM protein [Methanocorpusculum sp.]|nr:radical SAM protein [Methanocorpusculum sp.]